MRGRGRGGIGIRSGLKIHHRKVYEFESHRPYQLCFCAFLAAADMIQYASCLLGSSCVYGARREY